jgi:hypothetical protein
MASETVVDHDQVLQRGVPTFYTAKIRRFIQVGGPVKKLIQNCTVRLSM